MVRSSDGKMRIDTPNTTVITNPAAQQAIVLDHLKKEAQIVPLQPQAPQMPQMQMPAAPQMPGTPQIAMQDLGKSFIEGHPVDGKRYTVQPPAMPQMPQAPQMPGAPPMPQAPKPPAVPTVSEIWTSTPLSMPVLTKVTTAAGVQTTYCKPAPMPEPDPSLFQIPPGYKVVMLKKS